MNKLIILFLSCFLLIGCSLVPKINFNTDGNVPQKIDKSTMKESCKGETKLNEVGEIIYCSKNYKSYAKNYEKKERRYTLKEKIINFFNNLMGYGFWIAVALVILCPSALGFIFGRIVEGIFGIGKQALNSTVRGIQRVRKEGKDLNNALDSEQDEKIKKYIRKLKVQEKIK